MYKKDYLVRFSHFVKGKGFAFDGAIVEASDAFDARRKLKQQYENENLDIISVTDATSNDYAKYSKVRTEVEDANIPFQPRYNYLVRFSHFIKESGFTMEGRIVEAANSSDARQKIRHQYEGQNLDIIAVSEADNSDLANYPKAVEEVEDVEPQALRETDFLVKFSHYGPDGFTIDSVLVSAQNALDARSQVRKWYDGRNPDIIAVSKASALDEARVPRLGTEENDEEQTESSFEEPQDDIVYNITTETSHASESTSIIRPKSIVPEISKSKFKEDEGGFNYQIRFSYFDKDKGLVTKDANVEAPDAFAARTKLKHEYADKDIEIICVSGITNGSKLSGAKPVGVEYGNISNGITATGDFKIHGAQGHGYAAERANTQYDILHGKTAGRKSGTKSGNGLGNGIAGNIMSAAEEAKAIEAYSRMSKGLENLNVNRGGGRSHKMNKSMAYQKLKKDVLGCYNDFLAFVAKADINDEAPIFEELSAQAKRIQKDKFTLIVAGEAKSGKSTFINAYLGQEILPMDVLQCSSSLVEIKYGEKMTLKAFYACGRMKLIEGKTEMQEFLRKHAALNDNYRDIPVNTIDNELILKYRDKKIPKGIITDFIKGVQEENIHNLPTETYNKKIMDYINERKNNWGDIVTQMIITYPFDTESMRDISIIDSPGVNAAGRVGDITGKYLEKADAIMFLRPITGVAVEANSFKAFLDSKSVDRNKNAMFLILTKTTAETSVTIQRACDEFVKIFGAQTEENRHGITKDQIIPVDSKAELYLNRFQNMKGKDILAELRQLDKNGELENFLKAAKGDAIEENDDGTFSFSADKFCDGLKRMSNFEAIDSALNLFGRKAQYVVLDEFIQRMCKMYEKFKADLDDQVSNYQLKVEDPKGFEKKIISLEKELNDIENRMNGVLDEIDHEYLSNSGKGGKIKRDADAVMEKYKRDVEKINGKNSYSLEELEKLSFRQVDIFRNYQNKLKNELLSDCDKELRVALSGGLVSFASLAPNFTPKSLEKAKEGLKKKATTKTWVEGGCFSSGHWRSSFSDSKFYDLVKDHIMGQVEDIRSQAVRQLMSLTSGVLSGYKKELRRNVELKKREIEAVESDQRSNEDIIKLINGKKQMRNQADANCNQLMDFHMILENILKKK